MTIMTAPGACGANVRQSARTPPWKRLTAVQAAELRAMLDELRAELDEVRSQIVRIEKNNRRPAASC